MVPGESFGGTPAVAADDRPRRRPSAAQHALTSDGSASTAGPAGPARVRAPGSATGTVGFRASTSALRLIRVELHTATSFR